MAGLTPQGFERDSVDAIRKRIEQRILADLGPTVDVSPESQLGQLIGIFANEAGMAWEAIEGAYHAFDPDQAEDFLLVALAKLTGTMKRGASRSRVECTVDLDAGATLLAGVHFAHVDDRPQARFTPEVDFTSPSDGTHSVHFVSEETGPVSAPATTLNVIATPVVGWNAITNANDAELGLPEDTNETLRARREQELQTSGNGTVDAIEAAVSKVADVQSVRVFENVTNVTDMNGVPPHSVETLVFDGVSPTGSNNDAIAQAIWNAKAGGIRSFGNVSGQALDRRGNPRSVSFNRVSVRPVYVEIDVDTAPADYVGDGALAVFLAERANALMDIGQAVRVRLVDSLVYDLSGVIDVTGFRLGFTSSPSGTTNLVVGPREIAHFDSSNIVVTSTP